MGAEDFGLSRIVLRFKTEDVSATALGAFRQALIQATDQRPAGLVVDLSNAATLFSGAVNALVEARSIVTGYGGAVVLIVTQRGVQTTLETTGLDRLFSIAETEDQAISILSKA